jgi:hypothetical protein
MINNISFKIYNTIKYYCQNKLFKEELKSNKLLLSNLILGFIEKNYV